MDAKILGNYIAARRKELGMTQANLAEKIHVTDKAVSRWERGVGLPDIDNLEALAKALDVSLVSLMRGKTCDEKHISIQDAEELVTNQDIKRNIEAKERILGKYTWNFWDYHRSFMHSVVTGW